MMRFLALVAGALLFAGCARKDGLPKTYAVKGKVLDATGNPLTGGQVQFQSPTDTTMTLVGNIAGDGSFSPRTIKERKEPPAAPGGEYQVTIPLPLPPGERAPPPPATLSAPYKVEAKDNTFEFR